MNAYAYAYADWFIKGVRAAERALTLPTFPQHPIHPRHHPVRHELS